MERHRTMKWLLWGVMAITAGILVVRCAVLLTSRNYNVASEANGLYGIFEVADGKPLYPPITAKPYGIYLYAPLHAFVNSGLIHLLGASELFSRVLTVRLVSLVALALAIGLLWLGVVRPSRVTGLSFGTALLLALSKFSDYATSGRNDTISLLLEMAALVFFTFYIRERKSRWVTLFFAVSCLSVWTRQTGAMVFVSAMLWLAYRREFRIVLRISSMFVIVNGFLFLLLYLVTQGNVMDHMFLSNIRGFRPVNRAFFDASLLSFLASYILFVPLVILGIKRDRSGTGGFITTVLAVSALLSSSFFMRAGGDVNYYFLSLFVGVYFAALTLDSLFSEANARIVAGTTLALIAQFALVGYVYVNKSISARQSGSLPFAVVTERIKSELPERGYVLGYYAQSLSVYLRGWALYGPDVTNGGVVANNAHVKFRRLIHEADAAIRSGEVQSLIIATPGCEAWTKPLGEWQSYFTDVEAWNEWICVYRSKVTYKHLVGLNRAGDSAPQTSRTAPIPRR
jgi:hypothetical protein